MSLHISREIEEQLRRLAQARGSNVDELAQEAVQQYLVGCATSDVAAKDIAGSQGELDRSSLKPPPEKTTAFRSQIASDIIRDGLGVELLDARGTVVAEVFRSDADHTVTVSTFGNDIPLYAIEDILTRARVALDPFEDGGPLSHASP
jgi:hypothetical protein